MPNLGTSGRRLRLVGAIALAMVSVAGVILLRASPGAVRWVLWLPIFLAVLSGLQARTAT